MDKRRPPKQTNKDLWPVLNLAICPLSWKHVTGSRGGRYYFYYDYRQNWGRYLVGVVVFLRPPTRTLLPLGKACGSFFRKSASPSLGRRCFSSSGSPAAASGLPVQPPAATPSRRAAHVGRTVPFSVARPAASRELSLPSFAMIPSRRRHWQREAPILNYLESLAPSGTSKSRSPAPSRGSHPAAAFSRARLERTYI